MGKALRARCETDGAWIRVSGPWGLASILIALDSHVILGHDVIVWEEGKKDAARPLVNADG